MIDIALKNMILQSANDALGDLRSILAFLFLLFVIIEIVEYFYINKISDFARVSKKFGPLLGALLASFPQCGFSVIASVLYIRGFITRGTLLSVYLATSDEAIPVLLTQVDKYKMVLPLILIKVLIGALAGFLFDRLFNEKTSKAADFQTEEKGCCAHTLSNIKKSDLIIHPIKHTLSVGLFIFLITFILNFAFLKAGDAVNLASELFSNSPIQPVILALIGLIPNCAISVAFALMYIKGAITFSSALAGLLSGGGLGVWVLLRKNPDAKDSLIIVTLLFLISAFSGLAIFYLTKFVQIFSSVSG